MAIYLLIIDFTSILNYTLFTLSKILFYRIILSSNTINKGIFKRLLAP